MAASASIVAVTSTAGLLTAADADRSAGQRAVLKNTGAATVFVGGSGVTTATGYPLAVGDILNLELSEGGALYGIAATTGTVAVLNTGV